MSLVQLESFVAVAEESHLGRAARRLHVSQPPLTRRIKSLEDDLGVTLFERTPRGMRLLPAGEVLLHHARDILRKIDETRTELQRHRDVDDGPEGLIGDAGPSPTGTRRSAVTRSC